MKLFDKKTEKKVWIGLVISIPFLVFVLWKERGGFGKIEIIISLLTLSIGVGVLYFVKWYSNKK
ncbi:hypothetical protein [Flavobacterium sp.]|jgi:hypothetical protein|uniref:hypothetical protein n=1 Tax=Flavobacterium sp. TaxID=239 RepID=UPI002A81C727|nr:hypothetical protein [Flavobacterium sp.]